MFHRLHVCSGQKRGSGIGKTKKDKIAKILAITDASGFPVSYWVGSANTHGCILVKKFIDASFVKAKPKNLIGDMAYDSNPLDKTLLKRKINTIASF
jgi:hypothetical protein